MSTAPADTRARGGAPGRSAYQSFTGPASVRHPAPDVARGFMLLLIALANVALWVDRVSGNTEPAMIDRAWLAIRAALVDVRSFPLFALLFGFGLATMAQRRIETAVRAAQTRLDPGLGADQREQWLARAREEATVDARRLLRRRGAWMIVFGACHGLLFPGDIIGAYGVTAVLLAGLIARRRRAWMIVVGLLFTLPCLWTMTFLGWVISGGPQASGADIDFTSFAPSTAANPFNPLSNLISWLSATFTGVLFAPTVPVTLLGVRLARSDLMSRPDRHRRGLLTAGAACLSVGVLGAIPIIVLNGGWISLQNWSHLASSPPSSSLPLWLGSLAPVISVVTGIIGACGWLALLAAWAGPAATGAMHGARWLLSAVGKRSMTAYVGQTLVFLPVFGALHLLGVTGVSQAAGALIAVAAWALIAAACARMEHSGRARGPLEVLLRHAVAASARTS